MSTEPIVISDDEEEDLLDFFTVKKHFKPIPQVDLDEPEAGPSDYSSDEEGRRRKRKRSRKQTSTLPDWTRGDVGTRTSEEVEDRRSQRARSRKSSDREPSSIIVISDEEDEVEQTRVELTPPPKLTAAKQAEIRAAVARHTAATQPAPAEPIEVVSEASSPPPEDGGNREKIRVNVRMVADRQNMPKGASATAVRQFEKLRSITVYRDQKVDVLWHTVASRIFRDADDLVFVHDGHKIYSRYQTARQLLIDDEAEITGYEKGHWDRIQQAKREELRRQLADPEAELEEEGAGGAGGQSSQQAVDGSRAAETTAPAPAAPAPPEKRTKISLRATSGTYTVKVADYVTGATLAEVFCRKAGRELSEAKGLRLVFDGERIAGTATVGELDIEDGDIIDVE